MSTVWITCLTYVVFFMLDGRWCPKAYYQDDPGLKLEEKSSRANCF